jgi:cytochrome c oxidase subunit III
MSGAGVPSPAGWTDPARASEYLRPFDPALDAPLAGAQAVDWDSGPPVERGRFAMWLFLSSEVLFFAALIAIYCVLRQVQAPWPSASTRLQLLPATLATSVLVLSSGTAWMAVRALRTGRPAIAARWCGGSALLGTVFLAFQGLEWRELWISGSRPNTDLFGSTFYVLTGAHGAHVVGGIVALIAAAARKAWRPSASDSTAWLENAVLYWHFVDVVWLTLFALLYLW